MENTMTSSTSTPFPAARRHPRSASSNGSQNASNQVADLMQRAALDGTLSAQSQSALSGSLGPLVIAGAAGMQVDDIVAQEVTLMTLLVDQSSSIAGAGLEDAVRRGHKAMLEAFSKAKERDAILCALWTFHHEAKVVHSYVPVQDATRLDKKNYRAGGTTHLYDTWCDALASNVAYAQQLRDNGTPCRSIVVVLTDGYDVGSAKSAATCRQLSEDLLRSEQFVLAFVGVGQDADFKRVAKAMGIPERSTLVERNATESGLRQAFDLVSRSAIRVSQGQISPGAQTGFFSP